MLYQVFHLPVLSGEDTQTDSRDFSFQETKFKTNKTNTNHIGQYPCMDSSMERREGF